MARCILFLAIIRTAMVQASFLSLSSGEAEADELAARVPADAPEWCKDKAQLTWSQRKANKDANEALKWTKKQVQAMKEKGQGIPSWMEQLVSADSQKGALKWTVQAVRQMRTAGKDVPKWMLDIAENDAYHGRRWAACKAAEFRAAGQEVPKWMLDNAKQAVLEAAEKKIKGIEEDIDELESQKLRARAIVEAGGDAAAMENDQRPTGGDDKQTKDRIATLDNALSTLAVTKKNSMLLNGKEEKRVKVHAALKSAAVAASRLASALNKEASRVERADEPSLHVH